MFNSKKRLAAVCVAVSLAAATFTQSAIAHTISVGVFNSGSPGNVTLVLGTYDHGPILVQGAVQLIAGPMTTGVIPYTTGLLTKPAGLIDGTNNFYADTVSGTWGTAASDSFNQTTNTVELGPVINWLAADFTGLVAGTYTYQITGMTAANWNNVNSFSPNWTGTISTAARSTPMLS